MKKFLPILVTLCFSAHSQMITTVAGGGFSGLGDGGPATSAELNNPHGIGIDASGNIYISDGNNQRIRKVDAATGVIVTVVGTGTQGYNGNGISAAAADINSPWGLTLDASGKNIYFCDLMNNRVRKVSLATGIISNVAGRPANGMAGTNSGFNGDSIPADSAKLYQPMGVAVDASGNVYIADLYNNRIRKVTASTGIITTIAGTGGNNYNGDGIPATTANVFGPTSVAVDAGGNVYIADNENNRIRKITASTGLISTVCGNGGIGYSGDGGPATSAQLRPYAICVDAAGNIYATDSQNSRVRKIDAATGIITTIAGTGSNGYNGNGIPASTAQIASTSGIFTDASGNVYISDSGNNRVRRIGGTATAISNINQDLIGLMICPNPFSSRAIISLGREQKNATITLKDLLGRIVASSTFSGYEFAIEKGEMNSGVYILEVKGNDGATATRRIVVE